MAHAYLPPGRLQTLDAAILLVASAGVEIWPLGEADVAVARQLHDRYPLRVRETSVTWLAAGDVA